jgi:hypothetical protein
VFVTDSHLHTSVIFREARSLPLEWSTIRD